MVLATLPWSIGTDLLVSGIVGVLGTICMYLLPARSGGNGAPAEKGPGTERQPPGKNSKGMT
jgi:hypothetical protein